MIRLLLLAEPPRRFCRALTQDAGMATAHPARRAALNPGCPPPPPCYCVAVTGGGGAAAAARSCLVHGVHSASATPESPTASARCCTRLTCAAGSRGPTAAAAAAAAAAAPAARPAACLRANGVHHHQSRPIACTASSSMRGRMSGSVCAAPWPAGQAAPPTISRISWSGWGCPPAPGCPAAWPCGKEEPAVDTML